jgi:uncharacterized membrane protein
MTPLSWIKVYGLTLVVFLALDVAWISTVVSGLYQKHLGHLLGAKPLLLPALLFYCVYVVGILVFAVQPGLDAGSLRRAVALGAFLGFLAYATFDLTSMSVFRDFPVTVVVTDLLWGTVFTASVAAAGFGIARWVG